MRLAFVVAAPLALVASGCTGGGPLLHPAEVLPPGFVSVAGGLSGEAALKSASASSGEDSGKLQTLTVGSGVAPFVAARVGLAEDNEAGISYTGRLLRLDGRHAFSFGKNLAFSLGAGASAIVAERPSDSEEGTAVYGGGIDVPLLLGFHTSSDLYSLWIGPRAGVELLRGTLNVAEAGEPSDLVDAKATHFDVGGVAGLRVGFRHVHVAVELDGAWHTATGTFGDAKLSLTQVTLTPAGALVVTF